MDWNKLTDIVPIKSKQSEELYKRVVVKGYYFICSILKK